MPPSYMSGLTEAQNHRCGYCGHPMIRHTPQRYVSEPLNGLTKDHVTPRVYGGPTELKNLIAACRLCNNLRGEMDAYAFYNLLKKWFKHDPNLQKQWHSLSKGEIISLKQKCLMVHERQLRGLAKRNIVKAFEHYEFVHRTSRWYHCPQPFSTFY